MKKEEAIKMLKQLVNMLSDDFGDSELCEDALQMAITALQNQPVWIPLPETYQGSESHKQTKADEIRSMTDEELAAFIINFNNRFGEEYEGEQSFLSWLQKESEE